jgi:hypothetical protein
VEKAHCMVISLSFADSTVMSLRLSANDGGREGVHVHVQTTTSLGQSSRRADRSRNPKPTRYGGIVIGAMCLGLSVL